MYEKSWKAAPTASISLFKLELILRWIHSPTVAMNNAAVQAL